MIERNGKFYDRVSDILKPYTNFTHIDPWVLQNKCEIGTTVHQAINDYLIGDFPAPGISGAPYFESFIKWYTKIKPEVYELEKRYFNDDKMITGQIDALMGMPGDFAPVLIDYKTSSVESPTWVMQGHLYHFMVQSEMTVGNRVLFLKLSKEGKFPTVFEYKICPNIHRNCMIAIEEYKKLHKVVV